MTPIRKPELPGFDAIIDQDRVIRTLRCFLRRGTLPHALLFTGIEGVGKRTTARAFAMALNCAAQEGPSGGDACGACSSCRRIASGMHPDVRVLEPAGKEFRIDQVRELCRELALRPYEGRYRVALLAQAERMNPHAANALLKALEEPPERTVIVLTAPQGADLLPTIVSRCRQLRFKPIAARRLAAILERAHGVPAEEAELTAAMAGGSVTRALAMRRAGWMEGRRRFLAALAGLAGSPPRGALVPAAEFSRGRAEVEELLVLCASWARDLAVVKVEPERVLNRDLLAELKALADRLPEGFALRAWSAIRQAERRLAGNVNPRGILETLFLELAAAGERRAAA